MLGKSSIVNIITYLPIFIKMMDTALLEVNSIEKPLTQIEMGPVAAYVATWMALRVPVEAGTFTFSGNNDIAGTTCAYPQ